ncbi:hypothetical protein HA464_27435 (plasmid) [Rhizobium leguminosarum bv. trifolii]|uniref:hypothetical protein n=1 Tax=Rhizobium ruizarguesonis TaxID=2081791 RepID=UPI000371D06B|nr:hypothetical protein [Rhizobium ruizarguesonis]MBY5828721.1 hypothetical protein [Rhizobium leguminosarum]NKK54501.1 hypothetical protein [Rhizobium leguminosarum bv. viciae]QIO47743.1 hypothetical protein HA464_27435 [Rhizobium leguminosarum bv. trifolii]MBY5856458.1 hypothetical protein [Rhizobium leguminosarum]MBY5885822.1 hypothetical protein [Rhizobium leguminosarum]
MSEEASDADRFLALVAAAQVRDIRLTSIQAGLLVAADLGIARDSRAFARLLGIAHSLVLRELNVLAEREGVLQIVKRDLSTMRVHYTLPPRDEA